MTDTTPDDSQKPELTTVYFIRRAIGGDPHAFTQLFQRHYRRVVHVTASKLGRLVANCRHEVEGAVSKAFADTFRRIRENTIPDIMSEGAFRKYVATAAANAVRAEGRKRGAEAHGIDQVKLGADLELAEDESLFAQIGLDAPGPGTVMRARELEERLEMLVLELPQPYRSAIQLHCYCGLSYDEIIEQGELRHPRSDEPYRTRAQIKVIVMRARQKLAVKLADAS